MKIVIPRSGALKYLSNILLKFSLFTLFIFALYYGLVAFPLSVSAKYLATEKSSLMKYKADLVSRRIAIMGLYPLNTRSHSFIDDKETATGRLAEWEKNKPVLKTEKPSFLVNSKAVTVYKNEIRKLSSVNAEVDRLLVKQNEYLSRFYSTDKILANIYAYDPSVDLKVLDYTKDREKVLERIGNADKGLRSIIDNLDKEGGNGQYATLTSEIKNIQALLNDIKYSINEGNISRSEDQTDILVKRFDLLKENAYKTASAPLYTTPFLQSLAAYTDLINSMDPAISSITKAQEILNTKRGVFR